MSTKLTVWCMQYDRVGLFGKRAKTESNRTDVWHLLGFLSCLPFHENTRCFVTIAAEGGIHGASILLYGSFVWFLFSHSKCPKGDFKCPTGRGVFGGGFHYLHFVTQVRHLFFGNEVRLDGNEHESYVWKFMFQWKIDFYSTGTKILERGSR